MTRPKSEKARFHVAMKPDVAKRLKIMAITHDLYPGDLVEAGLLLLENLTPAARAALLASFDDRAGALVQPGETEQTTLRREQERAATRDAAINADLAEGGE